VKAGDHIIQVTQFKYIGLSSYSSLMVEMEKSQHENIQVEVKKIPDICQTNDVLWNTVLGG